jgi:hypothetical protein
MLSTERLFVARTSHHPVAIEIERTAKTGHWPLARVLGVDGDGNA